MISPIEESDYVAIRRVLADAIRATVAETESEAENLIADVEHSLEKWEQTKVKSHHLKHVQDGVVTGFVIVKEYWNLSHLFVLPGYQRQGIGRQLISATVKACRTKRWASRKRVQETNRRVVMCHSNTSSNHIDCRF